MFIVYGKRLYHTTDMQSKESGHTPSVGVKDCGIGFKFDRFRIVFDSFGVVLRKESIVSFPKNVKR